MAQKKTCEVQTWNGVSIRIYDRGDGRANLKWKAPEGWRNTTCALERAHVVARRKAKELANAHLGCTVTIRDKELLDKVKDLAGDRSPFAILEEIERLAGQLRGSATLSQAVQYYIESGMLGVKGMSFATARGEFLQKYIHEPAETQGSMRKILDVYHRDHPHIMVHEIERDELERWLESREKGGRVAEKTFNNRLGYFRTFMNCCREWQYLAKRERHVAELIPVRKEPEKIPAVLRPQAAAAALMVLPDYLLPTFIIGCWLGPRPRAELRNLTWGDIDWERGYLHVTSLAAKKTARERFVSMPANVQYLLKLWRESTGNISGRQHIEVISRTLREKGIIPSWPQDVMRHSYISYQIALGHGIGQIAEWAGTSEKKIKSNYRRPLRREDGEAWFAVGLPEK